MQPNPTHSGGFQFSARLLWTMLILGIAAGIGAWWLHHKQVKAETDKHPAAPVSLAPVTHKDVPVFLTGLGTVQAYNSVTVHSRVDGQLMDLPFTEGQNVRAGDVLAQLDSRPFQAQMNQALATKAKDVGALANARHDLARYKYLGDSIAKQTVDTQETTVKQLEATVDADEAAAENAQVQLGYTTITSPIDGRTGIRQVDVGNIVRAGDANGIVVVSQIEPVSVLFSLPQQHLPAINTQLDLGKTLTVDALSSDNGTVIDSGEVALVDNQIDSTTGTIKLKATFPNREHMLWPGGFTNVRLLVALNPRAMVIPTVAVQHGPKGPFVFAFTPDAEKPNKGTVAQTPVMIGIVNGEETEIISGLGDGDRVVIDGMAKLQDASKVKLPEEENGTKNDDADSVVPSPLRGGLGRGALDSSPSNSRHPTPPSPAGGGGTDRPDSKSRHSPHNGD